MTFHVVGAFPLGGFNIAAAGAAGIVGSLTAELDVMLFGPFGFGSFGSGLAAQFDASIQSSLNIGLQLTNPLQSIELVLGALANLEAALIAASNIGIPTVQISAQLSANASITALLGAQLSGIQGLVSAALSVKLPAIDFIAALTANLAAGPVVVASWGFSNPPDTMFSTGAQIASACSTGFGGLLPSDHVYGVMLMTSSVSASVGISATLLVA